MNATATERHYTPKEVAELWALSVDGGFKEPLPPLTCPFALDAARKESRDA